MAEIGLENAAGSAAPLQDDRASLKRKLRRASMTQRLRALGLVAPLLLFVIITFILPIGDMLFRAVENDIVVETLPRTVEALKAWDPAEDELPGEDAFRAIVFDIREAAEARLHTRVGQRLNYEQSGISSLFRTTPRIVSPRRTSDLEEINARFEAQGYKTVLIAEEEDWGNPEFWRTIKTYSTPFTSGYFVSAIDRTFDEDGDIVLKPENERLYIDLFVRTLMMSVTITLATLLLGYPIAYLLATLPLRTSNLLLILVLLPFWTSLLVRTSAWIVLLQQQGVVNDILVFSGLNTPIFWALSAIGDPTVRSLCQNDVTALLAAGPGFLDVTLARGADAQLSSCMRDVLAVNAAQGADAAMAAAREIQAAGEASGYGDERFTMIFNRTGTIVAMTHILLPFMVLPLYSVMKTIPPSYVRAAKSLGATNSTAFWKVYFPNTIPGVGAGAILVFILAIGYYITPELVGGNEGTFISNRIAFHISTSLNWGLAAALGALLLIAVLILYYAYDRIVGVDNVKLG